MFSISYCGLEHVYFKSRLTAEHIRRAGIVMSNEYAVGSFVASVCHEELRYEDDLLRRSRCFGINRILSSPMFIIMYYTSRPCFRFLGKSERTEYWKLLKTISCINRTSLYLFSQTDVRYSYLDISTTTPLHPQTWSQLHRTSWFAPCILLRLACFSNDYWCPSHCLKCIWNPRDRALLHGKLFSASEVVEEVQIGF